MKRHRQAIVENWLNEDALATFISNHNKNRHIYMELPKDITGAKKILGEFKKNSTEKGTELKDMLTEKAKQISSTTKDVLKQTTEIIGHGEVGRLEEKTKQESHPTMKVFIAGSKKLKDERSKAREVLSQVQNEFNIDIRSYTFEDFSTSLAGREGGRQVEYNKFIENEVQVVVFIFGKSAGKYTEKEFDTAYGSLSEKQHPDIFVYVRKPSFVHRIIENPRLRKIKEKISSGYGEYYVEYKDCEDLKNKMHRDLCKYFRNKLK